MGGIASFLTQTAALPRFFIRALPLPPRDQHRIGESEGVARHLALRDVTQPALRNLAATRSRLVAATKPPSGHLRAPWDKVLAAAVLSRG
jgi:hypothetical protein